VGAGVLSLD